MANTLWLNAEEILIRLTIIKSIFSFILLAACDANYCFTLVDIGSHGSINDTSTLSGLLLGKAFEDSSTNFCILAPLRIGEWELPYVLLGDDVFPLKPWLMKSYLEKNLQEC